MTVTVPDTIKPGGAFPVAMSGDLARPNGQSVESTIASTEAGTQTLLGSVDVTGPLFFAGMQVISGLLDANFRGAFLTEDGMLRGNLAVGSAGRNGLSTAYDPATGVTTFSLGSEDGVLPLTSGGMIDTRAQYFIGGKQILFGFLDPAGAVGFAVLEDGSFYVPNLNATLPVVAGINGVTVNTDVATGKIAVSLGTVDKQLPLSGGGVIDSSGTWLCPYGEIGQALGDSAGALWLAGLLDGRTYIPRLLVGSMELANGSSFGGSDFADTAAATYSAEKPAGSPNTQIVRRQKATGQASTITALGNNTSPSVSSDGSRIIYTSDRSGSLVKYSIGTGLNAADETLVTSSPDLVMIGDSRTVGIDAAMRAAMPQRSIDNQGASGQKSPEIVRRLDGGNLPINVVGGSIPESGSVGVNFPVGSPNPFLQWNPALGAMHAIVAGVAGSLVYNRTANASIPITFVRDAPGAALAVTTPTMCTIDGGSVLGSTDSNAKPRLSLLRQRTAIIAPGYNDLASLLVPAAGFTYSRETLLANIAAAVNVLSPMVKHFVISGIYVGEWGLVNGSGGLAAGQSTFGAAPDQAAALRFVDEVYAVNVALQAAYPSNFVDLMGKLAATFGETATINGQDRVLLSMVALSDGIHPYPAATAAAIAGIYVSELNAKGF